jgi:tRNA threonylcarbamoyladenosine biosynthesis protein TsaB
VFQESRYIPWNQGLREADAPIWHANCSPFAPRNAGLTSQIILSPFPIGGRKIPKRRRLILQLQLLVSVTLIPYPLRYNSLMIFLALDTCDARGSVAVLRDAELLQVIAHDTPDDYSVWLLPAVARVLSAATVAFADVDGYIAATGPGSFTGVRVGLTTVKAWAEVTRKPIVGVSRLEALATETLGSQPYVAAFTDGQRRQVFAALYRRQAAALERVGEEAVLAPEKFLAAAVETAGSESIGWISTDPQILVETEAWAARQSVGETVHAASPILAPAIGRLGYRMAQDKRFTDPLALDANYVRRSDAEAFWKDRPERRHDK